MEPKPPSARLAREEAQAAAQARQTESAVTEFATAEELIRHDAARTDPPPTLAERVKQSIAAAPPPPRPWWRRLLGR
jgi:hypothetical protein